MLPMLAFWFGCIALVAIWPLGERIRRLEAEVRALGGGQELLGPRQERWQMRFLSSLAVMGSVCFLLATISDWFD